MTVKARVLRSRKMQGGDDGWTGWIQPVLHPKRYTLICCDCCLAHQMQFKIAKTKDGKRHIRYRTRRAELYTQMLRTKSRDIKRLDKGEKIVALCHGVKIAVLPNYLDRGKGNRRRRRPKRKGVARAR